MLQLHTFMADNRTNQSRTRRASAVVSPDLLREWAQSLGVSPAELKRIMAEVGPDLDKVRAYLNTRA